MSKTPTVPPTTTLSTAHWPTQQKIEWAKHCLNRLVKHREAMSSAARSLKQAPRHSELKRARTVLERYATYGARKSITDGDIEMLLEPADWYDDNGDVRKSEVAKMIAMLVGVLPAGNIPDVGIYVRILIDDVMACQPRFVELECTCRAIRTKQKFMPSICEFVTELDQQKGEWDERVDALDETEHQYAELLKLVVSTEQKLNMVVGDRVRHPEFGAGNIIERIERADNAVDYRVLFDVNKVCLVQMRWLEKLVEGDDGFTQSVAMLEHNSSLPMASLHDECQTVPTNRAPDDAAPNMD
jgi:hypothetical protein